MQSKSYINWVNTIFLIITPLVGIFGTTYLASHGLISAKTIYLALFFSVACGLSITAGYHRLFSHRSYRAHLLVRLFFVLFGSASFEGSVIEWSTDHRNHHLYTDTPKDPYNFKQGFWYAHMGWLFTLDESKRDFSNIQDLQKDPVLRFQHQYFTYMATFMGFIIPTLIASIWGDVLGGLFIAGALRMTITQHMTFCINSVCHAFGKQTYADRNTARDNWVTALMTYGEGFHNFHHKFPLDYRNGIRLYHFDPTKWLIRGLAYLGLAWDLKTVPAHRIIQNRLDMDKKRLSFGTLPDTKKDPLHALYDSISHILAKQKNLEKAYRTLVDSKINHMHDRAAEYRKLVNDYQNEMKVLTKELKLLLKIWAAMMERYLMPSKLLQNANT